MMQFLKQKCSLLFVICLGIFLASCNQSAEKAKVKSIDTSGQPTIGNPQASVEVVVFEEPKCTECKLFSQMIFPVLKKNYIDTGKIKYTFMPVSFISDSMNAAMAWVCAYDQKKNGEAAFAFVSKTYAHQKDEDVDWATQEQLLDFAKEASPEIDADALAHCLKDGTYQKQIEKNTKIGTDLMDGELGTPAVYINGVAVDPIGYDHIAQLIDQAMKK